MGQSAERHFPKDSGKNHPQHGEPTHGAAARLHAEASDSWIRQEREAKKAPLNVHQNESYTVHHADCLSDIALRRLRADHEKVNAKSIAHEEQRLRDLNSDKFHSLKSGNKRERDFLADGWQLKIYDSVTSKSHHAQSQPSGEGRPSITFDSLHYQPAQPEHLQQQHDQVTHDTATHHTRHHHNLHHQQHDSGHQVSRPASPADLSANPRDSSPPPAGSQESPDRSEARSTSSPSVDRASFYTHQTDAFSCSAVSLAMMHSATVTGRPPSPNDVQHFKHVTGTTSHGYRGSLETMANEARSQGMEAKAYEYGQFGSQGMNDLDKELSQGHTAVARIINPHTGNHHYIFIAGRNSSGDYIIGDPDRHNNSTFGHDEPISRQHLLNMMSGRDGFVAGWA